MKPLSLHHTAYVTHDTAATVDFYTRVLGMELISAVIDDKVPSTGDPWPYVHLFFELADGSTIAFFEALGLPPAAAPTHPAYDIFNHIALDVGSKDEVDRWQARLTSLGVETLGPVDHGIIYSVYFHDPNGIRMELTANVTNWKAHAAQAREDVASWSDVKAMAAANGGDPAPIIQWIQDRRARHKQDAS